MFASPSPTLDPEVLRIAVPVAISVIVSVVSPTLLALLTGRQRVKEAESKAEQRRLDKQEDYDRQDQLAERQTKALGAVADQASKAAELLVTSNAMVAATAEKQGVQLTQIHTLVNSKMTESMQNELDSERRGLVLLEKIVRLAQAAGDPPGPADAVAIGSSRARIAELEARLADRLKQTDPADHADAEVITKV